MASEFFIYYCVWSSSMNIILLLLSMMIDQRIPQELDYQFVIPKGFPSIYKQWQLDPMSSNKQWSNNDIVRFNFMNLGKGVFDPFRSYIQITVSTNQSSSPVGLLQIDSSAQSFIDQLVLYSNGRQIQRITGYSNLAAYLLDIGLCQLVSQGRQTEGMGYGSFDTMPFPKSSSSGYYVPRQTAGNSTPTMGVGNIFPTIGNYYPQACQNFYSGTSITNTSKLSKGHVSNSNIVMADGDANGGVLLPTDDCMLASLTLIGYANNIRGQYQAKFLQNKFPQSTQSIPNYQLQLAQSVSTGTGKSPAYPFNYSSSIPYQTMVRNSWGGAMYFNSHQNPPAFHTINSANFGFNSLFCPFYTRGTFQPCISATVPQASIFNGTYQQTKTPVYRRKFKIPVISGCMGVLIDPSRFVLLPLASLNTAMMQITLDPYAMFTSGYSDYCQIDSTGMGIQQKRNYTIEKIQYRLQTYHFIDQQMQNFMQISLVKEIILTTNFWTLGNQYQVPGGSGLNNSWIVGCNATHLNQLVVLCIPNDYQTYSFARKHFRISNNVTKFWSKIGPQYWPPQPYKGNGGNVCSNQIDNDNSIFVQNLYWSGSYMFSKSPLPRINPYNFAVNERPYSVTNKNTFYDPAMHNNQNYVFTQSSVNADTAMGMSWIHQNRVVGKAAYLISYTPFKQSQNVLQGINVSNVSNFQVVFQSDNNNTFPRDQTMYIFCRTTGIVKFTKQGITTYGRG